MKEPAAVTPEFSRPLPADSVGPQPLLRRIEAGPAEREGLAKRFDLLALDRLEASLELSRGKGEVIRLQGHFTADVVQSCVVTLGPVPAHLEVDFEMSFSASAVEPAVADLDPLAEEGPEPIPEGLIDLGEAVAQQLAIALDPYPRAPGRQSGGSGGGEDVAGQGGWCGSGPGGTEPLRGARFPQEKGRTRPGIGQPPNPEQVARAPPPRQSCREPRTRLNNARLRCPDCRVAPGLAVP